MEKNLYNWITAVHLKLTQHYKSTILQFKTKELGRLKKIKTKNNQHRHWPPLRASAGCGTGGGRGAGSDQAVWAEIRRLREGRRLPGESPGCRRLCVWLGDSKEASVTGAKWMGARGSKYGHRWRLGISGLYILFSVRTGTGASAAGGWKWNDYLRSLLTWHFVILNFSCSVRGVSSVFIIMLQHPPMSYRNEHSDITTAASGCSITESGHSYLFSNFRVLTDYQGKWNGSKSSFIVSFEDRLWTWEKCQPEAALHKWCPRSALHAAPRGSSGGLRLCQCAVWQPSVAAPLFSKPTLLTRPVCSGPWFHSRPATLPRWPGLLQFGLQEAFPTWRPS